MPGASAIGTEWLWEALVSCRHAHGVVMQLAPDDFDWNSLHVAHGTPLMATVNEVVRSGQVTREVRAVLLWCLRQGADPRRAAPTARGYSGGWGNGTEEFPHVPRVPHAGRSAITLVLGLINVLERISVYEHKGKYQDQLTAAKQLLGLFAQFRPGVPNRCVAEATVDMWNEIRTDEEFADVEIHVTGVADEHDDQGQVFEKSTDLGVVRAHSVVLCKASSVLRASLTSCMVEGQTRKLQVPGSSLAAVELLLEIAYTGKLPLAAAQRVSRNWTVGDRVDANWRGEGRWWPGRITAVHDQGRGYSVTYDEGGFFEWYVLPTCIRAGKGVQAQQQGTSVIEMLQVQLLALDLAHRWQVPQAISLLEQRLVECLRSENSSWFTPGRDYVEHLHVFEGMYESAILKDLMQLRAACKHFASESGEVRRHYERGSFSPSLTCELRNVFD